MPSTPYTYEDEEPDIISVNPNKYNNYKKTVTQEELIESLIRAGMPSDRARREAGKDFAAQAPRHYVDAPPKAPSPPPAADFSEYYARGRAREHDYPTSPRDKYGYKNRGRSPSFYDDDDGYSSPPSFDYRSQSPTYDSKPSYTARTVSPTRAYGRNSRPPSPPIYIRRTKSPAFTRSPSPPPFSRRTHSPTFPGRRRSPTPPPSYKSTRTRSPSTRIKFTTYSTTSSNYSRMFDKEKKREKEILRLMKKYKWGRREAEGRVDREEQREKEVERLMDKYRLSRREAERKLTAREERAKWGI